MRPRRSHPYRGRIAHLSLLLGVLWFIPHGWADAQSAEQGQAIFQQKCVTCHFQDSKIAPDLEGVTERRERDWLKRFIAKPDKMLAEKDPIAVELLQKYNNVPMPNQSLKESEVLSILAYLERQDKAPQDKSAATQSAPAQPPTPAIQGDAQIGAALFSGANALENGAASCISCHNVTGVGELGGGTLGPDLTRVLDRYGEVGLHSVLANTPFPTMQPIYEKQPLTPEERAHLASFFATTAPRRPSNAIGSILLSASLGFVLLLLVVPLVWRNRLQGVRRTLVEQASRKGIGTR